MEKGDKYIRVKEIGAGSFGKAVLVKDRSGKQYIIKEIDISSMNANERKGAINEVKLLSQCRHPYIITYRESFINGGKLSIVMDYADGGDLYKKVRSQKTAGQYFSEEVVCKWFTQALLALRYMHEKHIIHRDLKTQNFFLNSNGRLRVGDFGIAKVLENTAAFAKTQIGTPYYLSPEIVKAQPYSYASDIWSLGCVLYELCALRVPFEGPNIKGLVDKISNSSAPTIPSVYSEELRELCSSMLQKDWSLRPTTEALCKKPIVQRTIKLLLSEESKNRRVEEPQSPTSVSKLPPKAVTPGSAPPAKSPVLDKKVIPVEKLTPVRVGNAKPTRPNRMSPVPSKQPARK